MLRHFRKCAGQWFLTETKTNSIFNPFRQKYGVSNEDVIFVSSPPTFDPFMLDVAIALFVGATILTVGQSVRLAPKQLLDLLFPSSVDHSTLHQLKCSIMQTTPSLFMRWTHSEIAERVLSPSSSLRILALGGEAFPWIETIALWQDWSGSHLKRIFNLYGLTEMSCWASAYEVTSDDVNLKRSVPIGTPIDNFTRFELTSNGELLLKTKIRKCFQSIISDAEVMKRDTEFVLHTGDVFEQRNDNELIFKCRTNAVVKVFGRKIDLSYLEAAAGTVEQVYQACCVYERQRKIVVIFIVANDVLVDTTEIKNKIKNALQAKNIDIISEICRIERMPLSAHGKVSKAKLLQIFNSKFASDDATSSRSICFLRILNESLGINIQRTSNAEDGNVAAKRLKTPNDLSFLGLGGTSLKAMHILNGLEEKFGTQFPQLLPMLLDEAISIDRIVDDLEKTEIFQSERMPSVAVTNEMDAKQRERWSVDMKKCIDATPTILHANETTVVSVGSHSKWLYNVRATDGVLISSIELPDRIESQVTQCDEAHAIVGCYDGHLYCFNIFSGKIVWKFNSGGMIKCKSLLMDEFAIFGNYSEGENLWCVNAANGALRWSQRVGSKSIYSNPIQVNALDFIVCTLDGFMFRLDATDGTVKWTISTDAPIFSTPMLVQTSKKDFIISGAVNGRVSCWDGDKNHIWSHQIDGNIFTSFDCCTNSVQKTVVDVIFGSHNHHLYCLAFDTETELCSERWKCQVAAPIRATPRIFDFRTEKSVFCCSTNGDINIISHNRGAICQRFAIDGEIFSTPAIDACCAFIGSRNNLFYCFDVS